MFNYIHKERERRGEREIKRLSLTLGIPKSLDLHRIRMQTVFITRLQFLADGMHYKRHSLQPGVQATNVATVCIYTQHNVTLFASEEHQQEAVHTVITGGNWYFPPSQQLRLRAKHPAL